MVSIKTEHRRRQMQLQRIIKRTAKRKEEEMIEPNVRDTTETKIKTNDIKKSKYQTRLQSLCVSYPLLSLAECNFVRARARTQTHTHTHAFV